MDYWNAEEHVLSTHDVTEQHHSCDKDTGYHVIPLLRDACYWERECDAALSMSSSGSVSRCDDFDDVIVKGYTNTGAASDVTCVDDDNNGNVSDEPYSETSVYKNRMILNDLTFIGDTHPDDMNKLMMESMFQDTVLLNPGETSNGIRQISLNQKRIAQQKVKIALMVNEVGVHNIRRKYLNRLNMVLSLMLIICCVVGIGLFLLYMLSCDG
jgi:hypothetical protein